MFKLNGLSWKTKSRTYEPGFSWLKAKGARLLSDSPPNIVRGCSSKGARLHGHKRIKCDRLTSLQLIESEETREDLTCNAQKIYLGLLSGSPDKKMKTVFGNPFRKNNGADDTIFTLTSFELWVTCATTPLIKNCKKLQMPPTYAGSRRGCRYHD